MGGMIAGEMAAIAPNDLAKLVLVGAAGLWIPEHPIPDLFALLPHEYAQVLFHDPAAGAGLLPRRLDLSNMQALAGLLLPNPRRMATAGKILFPIPNRRVWKRLYRVTAETLVVWGKQDKLMPPVYGERWIQLIPGARLVQIDAAGHMLPYEQPKAFVSVVAN